jgi:biotin transporter BioY
MANKPKKKVSNIMLVVICIMIICYAIANFVLQYYTQIEVSPTLTTSWFAFWGVELISLTAIKTSKIKHNQDNENVTVEDEMEEIEE